MPSGSRPENWNSDSRILSEQSSRRGSQDLPVTQPGRRRLRAKVPTPASLDVALPAIGLFLKTMREALGLTQNQLVARTEVLGYPVSRAAISALEKGKHSPSAVTVMVLTEILHVDPMEIFDRLKMAVPVPRAYAEWTVEQLDARFLELFEARRFREALASLDILMGRIVASPSGDTGKRKRRQASVEQRRAVVLRRLGALTAAQASAERAISLSVNDPDVMARAYMVLTEVHLRLGNLPMATDAAERALQLASRADGSLLGTALLERGRVCFEAGRFQEAYEAFREARQRAAESHDDVHAVTSEGNMGACLLEMGKRREAERAFRAAVEMARKLRYPDLEARWTVEMGRVTLAARRLDEAARLGEEALRIAQRGEYWAVAFAAAMLLHRVARAKDPKDPDRHRVAYLKRLRSWVDEDVCDADYREFLQEVLGPAAQREGEA